LRETKEEMDCRCRRRYANNGNKTVEKPVKKEQNGRESLRRLKPIVGCNASQRRCYPPNILLLHLTRGKSGAWETDLVHFIVNGNID
jgi:hypothetical protein